MDRAHPSLFDGINLGIHEAGHLLFRPFGEWLHAAGGTILQLLAPVAAAVIFARQRDYFAIGVSGVWLATNWYGIAVYAADAQAMRLPLVTVGGGEARHDWNYLLEEIGLLASDGVISGLFTFLGFLCMWLSVSGGLWLLYTMRVESRNR